MKVNDYIKTQKENSELLRRRVLEVIEKMIGDGERINFYSVADKAGVSRVFLYKHDDIRKTIEAARISKTSKKELEKEVIRLRMALLKQNRQPK